MLVRMDAHTLRECDASITREPSPNTETDDDPHGISAVFESSSVRDSTATAQAVVGVHDSTSQGMLGPSDASAADEGEDVFGPTNGVSVSLL